MAVEAKRGCGWRKIGGTYLVSGPEGYSCDRLPFALCVCPVCGQGVKQARGWTWVDVAKLVQGKHIVRRPHQKYCECGCEFCIDPYSMGRAGLIWIGNQFYKTPEEFMAEGHALGFSRRIKSIPRGFKVGETWVLLAHPKAIRKMAPASEEGLVEIMEVKYEPGIFTVWRPTRIERMVSDADKDNTELLQDLEKRGITPIFLPASDPDHAGKDTELQQEELFAIGENQ
jgi:hypothetical protein